MCEFCNIASKKKDVFVVYENSNVMAFLDYEPINEGHILLISEFSVANAPKTGDVTEKIISAVRNAAAKIRIVDNVLLHEYPPMKLS